MTLKLTLKQLMLIIMSVLLVLTVVMSAIVVAKVGNVVKGLGGPSANKPPVVDTHPSGTEKDPTQNQDTKPDPTETKAPTKPKETEPNHEHVYVKSQTVAATCTDLGYTIYMCNCGKSDIRDFHNAKGHKYGEEELLEASCEKPGYRQATCQRCGAVDTREVFDALEHDYQLVEEKEPSCVQDGYEEYKCTHCEDVKRENEEKAQGHKWGDSQPISQPTETAPGEEQRTCSVCGDTETIVIPPTGNVDIQGEPEVKNDVEGWTEYKITVGTQEEPDVYTYIIWIAGDHSEFTAVFSTSGLTVTYKDSDGVKQQHVLKAYSDEVLTIDVDGNTYDEIPDLTQEPTGEPTEGPTQGPTEGTTGPTEGTTGPTEGTTGPTDGT